jgi:CheY-like chemotaxis protein
MDKLFEGKKILVVEDDFSSKFYLNKVLEKSGAKVVNADNGKEAVNLLKQFPEIDLVLMDLQMPVMDGYLAIKQIREFNKKVILIAQTAYGLLGDKEKIISAGFDDYLIKPITYNQLIEKLSLFLNKNHSG